MFFAASLWFLTNALYEGQGLRLASSALDSEAAVLNISEANIRLFQTLKARYMPGKRAAASHLVWERADMKWLNISFEELIQRLYNLYLGDRIFALESFSAAHSGQDKQEAGGLRPNPEGGGAASQRSNEGLVFHVEGYFLCLRNS